MHLFFPADPLRPRRIDPTYADEAAAADTLGLPWRLIRFEDLVEAGDAMAATRAVPPGRDADAPACWRGWMLRPDQYAALFDALRARGHRLIDDPAAYRQAHWLPEWYPLLAGRTPRSVWLPLAPGDAVEFDAVCDRLRVFGASPVILKDYVKSRKHEWDTACYIPSAGDRAAVERVTRRFVELQGPDLSGGLVYRAFERFVPLGAHPQSGMPLTREFRAFVVAGRVAWWGPYWDVPDAPDAAGDAPPWEQCIGELAGRLRSRCFTLDVAPALNGEWRVVEIGAGQVAGLPDHADRRQLLSALAAAWPDQ